VSLLTHFLLPSGLACVLLVLGLATRLWKKAERASWWLLAASGAMTVLFSSGKVAAALTSPLEYAHPTLREVNQQPPVRHIVVLTGWASNDEDMPLSGRMNSASAFRVLLALELYGACKDCEVIVSGTATATHIMGELLHKLGVPQERLHLDDDSDSTAASASHLEAFVGEAPFFLVTSAGHMPRSVAAFHLRGLQPIPAPTDHQLPKDWRRAEWLPRAESLVASNLAVHEILGLLWYRLSDRA
jgi:uncharacterized SAM-binding protein YcdF (DUF218 family)